MQLLNDSFFSLFNFNKKLEYLFVFKFNFHMMRLYERTHIHSAGVERTREVAFD